MTRMTTDEIWNFDQNYDGRGTCKPGAVRHIEGLQPDQANSATPEPSWLSVAATVRAR